MLILKEIRLLLLVMAFLLKSAIISNPQQTFLLYPTVLNRPVRYTTTIKCLLEFKQVTVACPQLLNK